MLQRRFTLPQLVSMRSHSALWRVWDTERRRFVALKSFHELTPELLHGLKYEYRLGHYFTHPNLVKMHELFVDERARTAAFTMSWAEGDEPAAYVWNTIRTDEAFNRKAIDSNVTQPFDENLGFEVGITPRLAPATNRPPTAPLDTERFNQVTSQLLDALAYLHDHHFVHGDIKPSNLRVDDGGMLQLIDFGQAGHMDLQPNRLTHWTPRYAAPEHHIARSKGRAEPITPASDLYSAGAMLFELATREAFDQRARKSAQHRKRALKRAGLEDWSVQAILSALKPAPEDRPSTSMLRRWYARRRLTPPPPSALVSKAPSPLIGRDRDVQDGIDALTSNDLRGVVFYGESGIGKSTLLYLITQRFLRQEGGHIAGGACRVDEHIPFRSADLVAESLVNILLAMPGKKRTELLDGLDPAPLTRLFSAFRRVFPPVASQREPLTPHYTAPYLHHAAQQFRLLCEACAQRSPLLILIDDLQWCDRESWFLLRELTRLPRTSNIRLLFSLRTSDPERLDEALIADLREERGLRWKALQGLTRDDARQLFAFHLRRSPDEVPNELSESILDLCQGNPFFVTWCARWARLGDLDLERENLTLSRFTSDLFADLSPAQQDALVLLALDGRGLSESAMQHAIPELSSDELDTLERFRVVSRERTLQRTTLNLVHLRLGERLLRTLPRDYTDRIALALAESLALHHPEDPERLADAWVRVGYNKRAARAYLVAARKAMHDLAAERAVELYERAFLWSTRPAIEAELDGYIQALEVSGQPNRAARLLAAQANKSAGRLSWQQRMRAAENYAASGDVQSARAAFDTLITELNGRTWQRTRRQQVRIVTSRLLPAWRILQRAIRGSEPASARRDALALAYCRAANHLGNLDILEALFYQGEALRLQSRYVSPDIEGAIFATEHAAISLFGQLVAPYKRFVKARARQAQLQCGQESTSQWIHHQWMLGSAMMAIGRFVETESSFRHVVDTFHAQGGATPASGTFSTFLLTAAMVKRGRLREAVTEAERVLSLLDQDLDEFHHQLYTHRVLYLVALADGEPERAKTYVDPSASPLRSMKGNMHKPWRLYAQADIALYQRDGKLGCELLLRDLPDFLASGYGVSTMLLGDYAFALARCLLLLRLEGDPLHSRLASTGVKLASTLLSAVPSDMHRALRAAIELEVALQADDLSAAERHNRALQRHARASGLDLLRHCAWLALDKRGIRIPTNEAYAWLERERIADPERFISVFFPSHRSACSA